ncbi:MAG: ABC transporter permease [Caldilineaceae bacterium]|nr:ABC transporter permease [Caldilineaceae bacterium]MCY4117887.1 ABC transporter permease [Caldilineaceae bacterium]MDE0068550.1 ABC transporter permease [Caldilineaceae bacterium]MDE0431938.1 ABC transporter permease [Caldilineaceae bacterium]
MATTGSPLADSGGLTMEGESRQPNPIIAFGGAVRRFAQSSPIGAAAVSIWLLMFFMAVFAPQLSPYDPLEADYGAIRAAPTAKHLLGTDQLGRDLLSRIIYGSRITLIVSITAVFVGDLIGFVWGIASGYLGQRFDLISQRVVDVLMSFPGLILALLLLVVLGAGLVTVIVAISVTRIPSATRITRAVVLSIKETSYVEAARMIGASNVRIMVRHVAPQAVAPILVVATLHLGGAIFAESALSFLGMGIPPPQPSWGNMLGGVLAAAFRPPWWLVIFPGLAITAAIMAANLFGDAFRDFLDPKLRRRID